MKFFALTITALLVSSALAQQTFTDVAGPMGISGLSGLGHSVAWCDFDNDKDLDVALSNQDGSGFWLYRNDVTQFTNVTTSYGLGGNGASRVLFGEVTGDNFTDLILDTGSSQKLFQNDNGTAFTDITSGSGLTGSPLCMADFDNDGHLDILSTTSSGCSVLYNSGSGVFTEQAIASGTWWVATCFDYDLDGDQDVYLGTYGNDPNALLRNDGAVFTNVTTEAGVTFNTGTGGITVGDYNNDGLIDLYLGNYSAPCCKLFQNNGDGTFNDVTAAAGVTGHDDTRTSGFADYNNDGWLDIFSSHHDFYSYSNIMWKNNGDGTFSNTGVALGLSGEWIGDYFGIAWGDYNNDGDIDLFAVGHIDKYVLFRNDQSETIPANYVILELEGTTSNYNAIGALAQASFGSTTLTRVVTAGEGYHDYHSLAIEFGLYDSPAIDSLQINWPSGLTETYYDIPANQYIYAVEGEGLTGISNQNTSVNNPISITYGPNPCFESISFLLSGTSEIIMEMEIVDISGRTVHNFNRTDFQGVTDNYVWNINRDTIPPGVYIYKVTTSTEVVTQRFTLL